MLVYYFFRARNTWNIFFDEIYQDFHIVVSGCSRHNAFGLLIPGFIYSSSVSNSISTGGIYNDEWDGGCVGECSECASENKTRESNLYNVKILADIYVLFRTLDPNMLKDKDISSRCRMFQLLLEYIIRNYSELYNVDYTLYERLQIIYLDKDNSKDKNKGKEKDISTRINNSSNEIDIEIEIIPILEEYYSILDKLNTICNEINIEMAQGTFIIAFYQNFRIFVKDARKQLSDLDLNLH